MIPGTRSGEFLALALVIALGPVGCSHGPGDGSGILLEGDPDSEVTDAVWDYDSGDRTTADEISEDESGARIDRTNLDVAFADGATVGEVNALLESVSGRIVNMLAGVSVVVVKIPDPGDLAGLEAVIAELETDPVVTRVVKAYLPDKETLPGNYVTSPLWPIDHQIAVGAPAAWNVREAIRYPDSAPPLLVVGDYFGEGAPNGDFDLNPLDATDLDTGNPDEHGYTALGIIAGRHNTAAAETSRRQLVTGVYPGTLDLRAVDYRSGLSTATGGNEMLKAIRSSGRKAVLNTALSYDFGRPPDVDEAEEAALNWIQKVRGDAAYLTGAPGGLELDFLHLTAAGNFFGAPDSRDATLCSAWTAGRLMSGLTVALGPDTLPLSNLTNTLVVENRANTTAPYAPGCLQFESKVPGDISAIGTEVWSLTGATHGADYRTGTSVSTAQVAGLAAYVWALDPSLSPYEVLEILVETSRTPEADEDCEVAPSPVIDAYAAVLAVDDADALDLTSGDRHDAPARLAILDVVGQDGSLGGDQVVDSHDLERFIHELETRDGLKLDYSRFDLNGDGYTGGAERRSRFNLDIDYPPTWVSVTRDIHGELTSFDEGLATDWDVLCYYAYSPLYGVDAADLARRDTLLAPDTERCEGGGQQIVFVSDRHSYENIFAMNPDGGGQTNLTPAAGDYRGPVWSPDGTKIAYESAAWAGEIWVMDADGTHQGLLTDNDPLYDGRPVWSPDGEKIAFLSSREDIDGDIWVMDADGDNPTNLTTSSDTDKPSDGQPSWSPDSQRIAFVSDREDDTLEVWVMDADGGNPTRLTKESGREPRWSPDGAKIAFWSSRGGGLGDIFVMSADGYGQTNLTNPTMDPVDKGAEKTRPRWSPDSAKILFTSDRAGNEDVWVMDADGSGQVNLTVDSTARDWNPVWSPDGARIVFNSNRALAQRSDIWIMDADGSYPENLTPTSGNDVTPDW